MSVHHSLNKEKNIRFLKIEVCKDENFDISLLQELFNELQSAKIIAGWVDLKDIFSNENGDIIFTFTNRIVKISKIELFLSHVKDFLVRKNKKSLPSIIQIEQRIKILT